MATIYVKSGGGAKNSGSYRGIWTTAGNWAVGDRVVAVNVVSYRVHECTTSGAGDAAEPTWNTSTGGTTTMAAGAVFTTRIPSTWANATVDLVRASANDAAGDTIYVSQAHAESTATNVTFAGAGTVASPIKLICANDGAEPPTAVATTGTVTSTSGGSININNSAYVYGLTFAPATTFMANAASVNTNQVYESCFFNITSSTGTGIWQTATLQNNTVFSEFINCTFKTAGAGNSLQLYGGVRIRGGSFVSGSTALTSIFKPSVDRTANFMDCSGFDFVNMGSSTNLFFGTGIGSGRYVLRNCKLPASWSGSLVVSASLSGPGERFEMYNCDSTDTQYRLWIEDYFGSVKSETTIVRSGGATDGTTALSWKMVTSGNSLYPTNRFYSPEIVQWNTTLSSVTVTAELVHDTNVAGGQGAGTGSRFQDDEIWLEVMYLGTSGFPLGSWISDCKADVLATATDQTDSSVTWTTTGLTTPQKQKLSVTITPAEIGYVIARIVMTKASKTIYVCPKLTVA